MNQKKDKKNKGQAIMEYIIISALIGIFCLVSMKGLMSSLKTKINHIKDNVRKHADI